MTKIEITEGQRESLLWALQVVIVGHFPYGDRSIGKAHLEDIVEQLTPHSVSNEEGESL